MRHLLMHDISCFEVRLELSSQVVLDLQRIGVIYPERMRRSRTLLNQLVTQEDAQQAVFSVQSKRREPVVMYYRS